MATAKLLDILATKSKNADYEVFNVGTGKPTNILYIAQKLIRLYNKYLKLKITNKYRTGDIRHCFADISKIKNKWGKKEEGRTSLRKCMRS